jgi:hypothetical protein
MRDAIFMISNIVELSNSEYSSSGSDNVISLGCLMYPNRTLLTL